MPSGESWISFLYVNAAFVTCIVVVYVALQISVVKANWSAYRCNPMFMPLADNVSDNFSYCVQNMQGTKLQYLLQPFAEVTGGLVTAVDQSSEDANNARAMFDKTRTFAETNTRNLQRNIDAVQTQLTSTNQQLQRLQQQQQQLQQQLQPPKPPLQQPLVQPPKPPLVPQIFRR